MTSEPKAESKQDLRGMWLTLAMTATFMVVVAYNTTAVITILPNLRAEFDLRPAALQWVMAIYTVSGASLVPVMGRLGDIHGLIKIFVLGMVIFTVGAVVVVIAGDSVFLLAGRLLQGVGAAASFGTSLGVLTASAPESRRAFVVGLWGAMVALGFSLGPIIGGLFAEYWTWRGIFYCDMVLFLVALGLAWRIFKAGYMPEVPRTDQKVDYLGAVLLILVLGSFAFSLEQSESHGWTAPSTIIPMVVTVIAAAIFYRVERRSPEPLLHLGYFRHPRFFMSAIGMFIACFVLMCFFFRFNIFVQSPDTFDMSPVVAGAAVLPLSIVMFVFSVFAVRVLQPYSFRWPVAIGMTCLTVACALLATTSNTATYGDIWWKILILGFGFGLTIPLVAPRRPPNSARGGLRPGVRPDQHVFLFRRDDWRGRRRRRGGVRHAKRYRPGRSQPAQSRYQTGTPSYPR